MIRIDSIWLATEPMDMRAGICPRKANAKHQDQGGLADHCMFLLHSRHQLLGRTIQADHQLSPQRCATGSQQATQERLAKTSLIALCFACVHRPNSSCLDLF
jgi:hypothetical protein